MDQRNRRHENEADRTSGARPGQGGAEQRDELREHAARLLEAGDEAIRRALSNDSERFLNQNRQQGGQ
jgi:hypothetical protein